MSAQQHPPPEVSCMQCGPETVLRAIDQFTDSTDATGDLRFLRAIIKAALQPPGRSAGE